MNNEHETKWTNNEDFNVDAYRNPIWIFLPDSCSFSTPFLYQKKKREKKAGREHPAPATGRQRLLKFVIIKDICHVSCIEDK